LERPHKIPYNLRIERSTVSSVWCGDILVIDATYMY
jgi:hypothetical protein